MTVRTTLTLDDDVAAALRRKAKQANRPFRDIVNDALRAGLTTRPVADDTATEAPSAALSLRPGFDLTKALSLAAGLEDQEITHRLELRK